MNILEVDQKQYNSILKSPFSIFETTGFCALNRYKVDDIKYLIFNDSKNRLGLIIGINEKVARVPFSAPFGFFSKITENNRIGIYYEALHKLIKWCKQQGFAKLIFSLPPHFYSPSDLTMVYNALHSTGFKIEQIEVNYEYYLQNFKDDYEMSIKPKPRQKFRASIRNKLTFHKTDDISIAYDIIKKNREEREFPLRLTIDDIKITSNIISIDIFIVKDKYGQPVSSAFIFKITDSIVRVIYWGSLNSAKILRPMNFLSFNLFKYYSNRDYTYLDIGHSTNNSIPNYGLCDFKQGLGCQSSPKFVYSKQLLTV